MESMPGWRVEGNWVAYGMGNSFSGMRDQLSGAHVQDGFIHFSTAEQLGDTARKHFAGQQDLPRAGHP